ncbi:MULTISPECIES: hypothetical protein [unclassified Variovorax]|uniref:hypothetical protein n=1 Tax=unclassified Variovorax TaxID=663243 RepID=UPI00076C0C58|nr:MULTISPECIES: hypothetical protein [unclassified Variovorax]KWT95528.1 hypothetical protein APY03_2405 [Variovorax sp. WDL1]PNG50131.1 hypothetical protein CHC06_05754 [Variovorax sp. B2]PNG51004.1 hypothetical protein CHC07_05660 [Variovorax sp. B4]VTU41993.1 hypothetical protein SRS16P1_00171 [Variovorax sp. SRS16]VTU42026.1 hypothetical protein E5P1_00169 [Variovorax sp. PBL-E5]
MKTILLALGAAIILSACAATGDDYVKGVVPEMSNHPALGSMTSAERALLGPDANANGIRDEIDRLIAINFDGARPQAAAYAAKYTQGMIAGSRGQGPTPSQASDLAGAASALDAASSTTLAARIANTPERRAAVSLWARKAAAKP